MPDEEPIVSSSASGAERLSLGVESVRGAGARSGGTNPFTGGMLGNVTFTDGGAALLYPVRGLSACFENDGLVN